MIRARNNKTEKLKNSDKNPVYHLKIANILYKEPKEKSKNHIKITENFTNKLPTEIVGNNDGTNDSNTNNTVDINNTNNTVDIHDTNNTVDTNNAVDTNNTVDINSTVDINYTKNTNNTTVNILLSEIDGKDLITTKYITEICGYIFRGQKNKKVFETIDIEPIKEYIVKNTNISNNNNLQNFFNLSCIQKIQKQFCDCGLQTQVCYTNDTTFIKLVISQDSIDGINLSNDISYSEQYRTRKYIVLCMQNQLPYQNSIEEQYQGCIYMNNQFNDNVLLSNNKYMLSKIYKNNITNTCRRYLLANRCLQLFALQTHLCIIYRKILYDTSNSNANKLIIHLSSFSLQNCSLPSSFYIKNYTSNKNIEKILSIINTKYNPNYIINTRLDKEKNKLINNIRSYVNNFYNNNNNFIQIEFYDDNNIQIYKYSPIYYTINSTNIPNITKFLIQKFWEYVYSIYNYYPTKEQEIYITTILYKCFISSQYNTDGMECRFNLNKQLYIYLYGTAGTGKSSFVNVQYQSLRYLITTYIDPEKRFDLIRLPLNQQNINNQKQCQLVRGISDWSLERTIEQCLCRDGIVVLQLEEMPESFIQQKKFYILIQDMLHQITTRYVECSNNIIIITTSNYVPNKIIFKNFTILNLLSPSLNYQLKWLESTIKNTILFKLIEIQTLLRDIIIKQIYTIPFELYHLNIKNDTTTNNNKYFNSKLKSNMYVRYIQSFNIYKDSILYTNDMRKQEMLKLTLSYNIIEHLTKYLLLIVNNSNSIIDIYDNFINIHVHIIIQNDLQNSKLYLPSLYKPHRQNIVFYTHKNNINCQKELIPSQKLKSYDGYFYHPCKKELILLQYMEKINKITKIPFIQLQTKIQSHLFTMQSMWQKNFFYPTVLVLVGTELQQHIASYAIRRIILQFTTILYPKEDTIITNIPADDPTCRNYEKNVSNFFNTTVAYDDDTTNTNVTKLPSLAKILEFFGILKDKKDAKILFGDPDPTSGLLVHFLQNMNILQNDNDNTINNLPIGGVVYLQINSLGQFMIRELTDEGNSKTHITKQYKNRQLFVLMVNTNDTQDKSVTVKSYLEPQLVSRSHLIIDLTSLCHL